MTKKKNAVTKALCITAAITIFAASVYFNTDKVRKIAVSLTLYNAQTFMPLYNKFLSEPSAENDGTTLPEKTTEKKTTAPTDSQTEKTTAASTTAKSTTEKIKSVASKEIFTDTPADILSVIKKEENKKELKKDGKISEYKYVNDGVTDKYGRVKVKNVNKTGINIAELLKKDLPLKIKKEEPSVLIFHSHTTETYQILDKGYYSKKTPTRTNDNGLNMARVGKAITEEIEKNGYTVIHDTQIHDSTYNTAYSHSRKSVEKYLKENPSIKIALDIHRDAIHRSDGTKMKPTATVKGKKAAQIMIISGCQEKGNIVEGFPEWKENLVFAVHLQNKLEELFEGITRPIYFSPRKYNMDMTTCSLLVEVGSDANTLEEAVYTGKCIGSAVSEILKEYEV